MAILKVAASGRKRPDRLAAPVAPFFFHFSFDFPFLAPQYPQCSQELAEAVFSSS
jgi:hypothetical protein